MEEKLTTFAEQSGKEAEHPTEERFGHSPALRGGLNG